MSLSELLAGVEQHEKTLTVFNAEAGTVEAVREQFRDRNLVVEHERTHSGGPGGFAVLTTETDDGQDEFVTATSVEATLSDGGQGTPKADRASARPILDHLDETMFTSYDTKDMVAASREIEDRAWRLGKGQVHAGFQNLSTLDAQMEIYEPLADKDRLEVHAYAYPDEEVPRHDSELTIHVERAEEIEHSWFVAYDGGGVDVNKCALLAEEREEGKFYGFWTYDPETVDWIIEYLRTSYGLVPSY
jgi:DICT domain-containing protein